MVFCRRAAEKTDKTPGELLAWSDEEWLSTNGYDWKLFTADGRPDGVRRLCLTADPSPAAAIGRCDALRADGRRGADIFSRPIVVGADGASGDAFADGLPLSLPVSTMAILDDLVKLSEWDVRDAGY